MRRLVLALVPALSGCVVGTTCDEPGALCLATGTVTRTHTGLGVTALASADLDGDGARDLVAAGEGTVSVMWGGAGKTGTATTWSIGQEVAGVAVADLDGDGRLDLATALPRADAVAVLAGQGGGEFAAPRSYAAGAGPRALIAADLDAGGAMELVTADLAGGTITVLRGLVAGAPQLVGPGPRALAAGDLDGDGDVDLAVALADADAVQVMPGDGRGGLLPGPRHAVGAAPRALALADLDDDGTLDIASADALGDTISVLYGDGAGGHRERAVVPTIGVPTGLVALTEAGRSVLAVLSEPTGEIARVDPRDGATLVGAIAGLPVALASSGGALHHGGLLGRFGELVPGEGLRGEELWRDPGGSAAWPVDLDGDGIDEVVEAGPVTEPGTLALRRAGELVLTAIDPGLGEVEIEGVVGVDLTGDGRRDLLVRSEEQAAALVQQEDGTFVAGPPIELSVYLPVRAGDVDGDGALELLALDDESWTGLLVWGSDAAGVLTELPALAFGVPISRFAVVDGDGDARVDVIVHVTATESRYFEDGEGPGRRLSSSAIRTLDTIRYADVDGDGRLDAAGCGVSGLMVVSDVLGSGVPVSVLGEGGCLDVAAVDVDGDGALDLLERTYSGMSSRAMRLTPHVHRGGAWTRLGDAVVDSGQYGDGVVAQLDGDGVPDVLAFGEREGTIAHRLTFGPALVERDAARFGFDDARCFGDVDGDGATDMIVTGNAIGVAFADGRGGFAPLRRRALQTRFAVSGSAIDACVLADFDGDGADELIVRVRGGGVPLLAAAEIDRAGEVEFDVLAPSPEPDIRFTHADIDGDGALDLVGLTGGSLSMVVLRGDGAGRFLGMPVVIRFPTAESVFGAQLADGDGDGALDVVAPGVVSGIMLFSGDGAGSFADGRVVSELSRGYRTLGDVDRDGRIEMIGVASTNLFVVAPGGAPRVVLDGVSEAVTADLDGDGRVELIAAGPRPSEPDGAGALYVGRPRDDGRLSFIARDVPLGDLSQIQVFDADGDGLRDVALIDGFGVTIVRQAP